LIALGEAGLLRLGKFSRLADLAGRNNLDDGARLNRGETFYLQDRLEN
jgi:hypothetical protein